MLLILREVLRAHVLDGAQLLIVLVVNVTVAAVDLLSHVLHVGAQILNLRVQLLREIFRRHLELLGNIHLLLVVLARIVLGVLDLTLLNVFNALNEVLLHLQEAVVCVLLGLRDEPVKLLYVSCQLVLRLAVVIVL